jgi:hypothetical protein
MEEIFVEIKNAHGYSVSNFGNVINNFTHEPVKFLVNNTGYFYIFLICKGTISDKVFLIHRLVAEIFIPNPENKSDVDHIDGNKQNNNVNNLRWCSHSENMMNTGLSKANTSGIKGVYYDKRIGMWRAQIMHNYKTHYLGCYNKLEDAAKARREKAKQLFGEFINKVELEINIQNVKPKTKIKLNININKEEEEDLEELEKEFEELIN